MLSGFNTATLREIVRLVLETVSPEKIFLLGATTVRTCTENIFQENNTGPLQVAEYYLLVLTGVNTIHSEEDVQDRIEQRCRDITPVTAIVHSVKLFNKWLSEGHLFATRSYQYGYLLHDARGTPLTAPAFCEAGSSCAATKEEFVQWCHRATEFFAGAELYTLRRQYTLAAFLLHQAMEHTCIALVKRATGYRANTHNLDKLTRYTMLVHNEVREIFPRRSADDQHLFRLLQKAYIHGRYKDNFSITEEQLLVLITRVKKLQLFAAQLPVEL